MKTFRETFEENYVAVEVPCSSKKGFKIHYEYCGPWYMWVLPASAMRKMKFIIAALCAAGIASFCASALQDNPINYSSWVSLPGTLLVAVMLFEIIGVLQFLFAKGKVTRLTFQDIDRKMKITFSLHTLLLLVTAAACVYTWCCERMAFSQGSVVFGYLISALCSAVIFHLYRRIEFKSEKNEVCRNNIY